MKTKLILFDVDGTLIHTYGCGMKAVIKSFEFFFNVKLNGLKIDAMGKTDFFLFKLISQKLNMDFKIFMRNFDEFKKVYFKYLNYYMKNSDKKKCYYGIKGFLRKLQQKNNYLGLITGNLKQGAYIKLSYFDLNKYFIDGGFAEDGFYRHTILKKAIQRFKKIDSKIKDIYVIGDTIYDIKAAKKCNVKSVLAIWRYNQKIDLKIKPDIVLEKPDMKKLFSANSQ